MSSNKDDVESYSTGSNSPILRGAEQGLNYENEDGPNYNQSRIEGNEILLGSQSDNSFGNGFIRRLLNGPYQQSDDSPQFFSRNTYLARFELLPYTIQKNYSATKRFFCLILYFLCCLGLLATLFSHSLKTGTLIRDGSGNPVDVISLSCEDFTDNSYIWAGKNQHCGLNAVFCNKSEDDEIYIRCPALCDRGWTFSAVPVGDQMIKYRQFSIGGGASTLNDADRDDQLTYPYRADSFACASAVHAGILSPKIGGYLRLQFTGPQPEFKGRTGSYNTGESVEINSFFPQSYIFKNIPEEFTIEGNYDIRLFILPTVILLCIPIIYLTAAAVSFWTLCIVAFWTVSLSLDPPDLVDFQDAASVLSLLSTATGRFLPFLFVMYVMWKSAVKRTFQEPTSPLSKLLLWFPLFWMGVSNNITFDRLPVDRLTPHDIAEMPGSALTVVFLLVIVVSCILIQAFQIWKSGQFAFYFRIYGSFFLLAFILSLIPGMSFRIHHYIMGMWFVPGTGTRGVSAFVLQGVLLGLLISGIAKWDFAPIIETNFSLLRGEAGGEFNAPPLGLTYEDDILSWNPYNDTEYQQHEILNGFSLMVNDVEVYVGSSNALNISHLIAQDEELSAMLQSALSVHTPASLYLRVGKSSLKTGSKTRGDYTMAGTLTLPDKNWIAPLEGAT